MQQPNWRTRLRKLWHTDCERCMRIRLMVLWTLLMLPLVLWWISK